MAIESKSTSKVDDCLHYKSVTTSSATAVECCQDDISFHPLELIVLLKCLMRVTGRRLLVLTFEAVVVSYDDASLWRVLVDPCSGKAAPSDEYNPPQVAKIWLWVNFNKIPIYPKNPNPYKTQDSIYLRGTITVRAGDLSTKPRGLTAWRARWLSAAACSWCSC